MPTKVSTTKSIAKQVSLIVVLLIAKQKLVSVQQQKIVEFQEDLHIKLLMAILRHLQQQSYYQVQTRHMICSFQQQGLPPYMKRGE